MLSLDKLVLISIDRYISVKHPLRYTTIVTKKRIKTGFLFVWATGLLVTAHELTLAVIDSGTDLYFLYMTEVTYFILTILALGGIVVISYTYCYIFSKSRRQKKRLQTEQLPEEEAKKLRKESKTTNTFAYSGHVSNNLYFDHSCSFDCRAFRGHFRNAYLKRYLELGRDI